MLVLFEYGRNGPPIFSSFTESELLFRDLKTENSQKDDSNAQNCMLNVVGLLLSKFTLLMLQISIACFD